MTKENTMRFPNQLKTISSVAALTACLGGFTRASAQLDPGNCSTTDQRIGVFQVFAPTTQNQFDFLGQLYADLLKRPADSRSLGTLRAMLSAGAARSQVAAVVTNGNEFRGLTIQGYYNTYLQRSPSALEITLGLSLLATLSEDGVQALMLGLGDYYERAGGSDSAFLQRMYQDLLNRSPSRAELESGLQSLQVGQTRASLAASLLAGVEHQGIVVGRYYRNLLRRSPSSAELSTAVAALVGGAGEEFVIDQLVGSAEYLRFAVLTASHTVGPCS